MSKREMSGVEGILYHQKFENYTFGELLEAMESDPDVDGAVIGGFSHRIKCYTQAIEQGVLTAEEARKLERLPLLSNEKQ
ncbi:hypothetical protein FACS189492_0300 [Clostridia bacterium]|nr:hypothetical protein FACS189492_0300 [Clostridia bacterium]